jgi:phage tail sheath protein FI
MAEKIISPGVFQNESDQSLVQRGIVGTATAIVGPTVLGQPYVPTYVTSYTEYVAKFGESFKSGSYYYEYLTSLAAKDYFNNGGQTLLVTRVISGSTGVSTYASASVSSILSAGSSSFVLETLAWGDLMNNSGSMVSGSLTNGTANNVRWEITNVDTVNGVFGLAIRAGNDSTAQTNYLESWPNLSLDPALPNFISRVIGDLKPVYSTDSDSNPIIQYTGSYANASRYVRVASVTNVQVDSIDNTGLYKSSSLASGLPATGSGSIGGAFQGGVAATNAVQLMNESITATNVQGFAAADYNRAFGLLTNKDEYQFNVLCAPGVTLDNAASATLISTCEGRGDAFAVVDTKLYGATITAAKTAASAQSSNYAATYWPWVQLYSSAVGKSVWAPASTVIGGVLAFNDQVGAEWFAPAGLNRGGVPSVLRAERKLSQNDRDTLYTANVNPLATFPGEGVVVFGQKTLQKKPTALDRVNVRRLLIALKGYIGQVANNLVFEQNTNVTRNRFLSQVNPYLESVVQRQGLYAYKVVMDDTNNTADVIDRNQLVGQIYIQPTKTAEFVILNFNVLPTGATFPA